MQERSHAFAMKSQIWLLDPRPEPRKHRAGGREGLRAFGSLQHAGHAGGAHPRLPRARPLQGARTTAARSSRSPRRWRIRSRDLNRIVLPPASYLHEKEKIEKRWPAAVKFIRERRLNERFGPARRAMSASSCQGGMYNGVMRALQRLGLADICGTHARAALRAERHLSADRRGVRWISARDKDAVLIVEEGQPEHHRAGVRTRCCDKARHRHAACSARTCCRSPANTPAQVLLRRASRASSKHAPRSARRPPPLPNADAGAARSPTVNALDAVPPRPPGFCTGCPERPIFAAMKLVEKELGPHHVAADIGCHLFSILPPFNIGATHDGLRPRAGLRFRLQRRGEEARRSRSWATAASGTTA